MRPITRAFTLGLLLSTAAPVLGQGFTGIRAVREIDVTLGAAETARLNANCPQRDQLLNNAQTRIAAARGRGFEVLTEEGQNEYYARLAEARARPCPPPVAPPPPPPAETVQPPAPPPIPPTPPPGSEQDANRRHLQDHRVLRDSFTERLNERLRSEYTAAIERLFAAAESHRIDARCAEMHAQLDNAGNHIGAASQNGAFTQEAIDAWIRRLDAARARPCPASSVPPPIQVIPDRRTGDAGPVQRYSTQAVSVSVGYASLEIPTANYAFVSDGPPPAPEVPAARSVRRPGGIAIEASLDTGRFGTFTIDYAQAEASNSAEIAAGPAGARRGYPHIVLSPSGSAGLSGNVAMDVDVDERVEAFRFGWNVHFGADPPAEDLERMRARLRAEAGVTLSYRDRDHLGVTSITTPVIATQRLEQEVTEWEIGVFGGLEAVVPLSADVRLTLGVRAGLDYYDFDLSSVETNAQNFGADADRAYSRSLKDSVGDIAYSGDAITELSFDLGPGFEMFARGRIRYSSDRAQVLNPVNGTFVQNGGTTRIGTDDAWDLVFSAGIRFEFGRGD